MVLLSFGNPNWNRYMGIIFSSLILKICGIRIEVEGLDEIEAHQPCIYVGNHQSMLDVVTYGHILPHRTVAIAKREVLWIPFFGLFFAGAGNIMIKREKKISAIAGLKRAIEDIKSRGVSVLIFPEGTRNKAGSGLLPFKKGAFHMAVMAKVPIVPIISTSLNHVWSWEERRLQPGLIRFKVLPPIDTSKYTADDINLLAEEVRRSMLAHL